MELAPGREALEKIPAELGPCESCAVEIPKKLKSSKKGRAKNLQCREKRRFCRVLEQLDFEGENCIMGLKRFGWLRF